MQYLQAIYAGLQLVLFVLTRRAQTEAKNEVTEKQLEVDADEAIRSLNVNNVIAIWNRVREYKANR